MDSSGGTSSGSSMHHYSGSEEDLQVQIDGRKRRRVQSNRESVQRFRLRKKKHLDDLTALLTQLQNENQQIRSSVNLTTEQYKSVEAENSVLRAQMSELTSKLIGKRMYDVFLSFRGEDTRASFVSHLYASLQNAGIIVVKDDESLPRGDHISPLLLQAIELSRISVIVFSRSYAESRWCLKELEKIMECHRTTGQVVLPVFYDVDPSEVRHQTGQFGKAFQNLENRILTEDTVEALRLQLFITDAWENDKILDWREALREAAGISGIVVLNSRNESEAIKSIVEIVTHTLDKTELFVADNPVGVESRVQDMIQLLDLNVSNDVLLLGMWGMGGIGKTTIAKAIYNKIGRNFEGRSFLAHIMEVWGQDSGQVCLQEQLLFDINKETKTKIYNVELGKNILMERLCHKKVLLILDDVNKLHQLNALCGNREWFGPGSRIIITTRDMHILRGNRVDKVYIMKGMDESESIELFSWHTHSSK